MHGLADVVELWWKEVIENFVLIGCCLGREMHYMLPFWFFVDNIIVIDHDVLELEMLKKRLGVEFEIKDHDE